MNQKIQKLSVSLFVLFAISICVMNASAQISCDQNSIVGGWRGVSGEGNGLVSSFIAGGNLISSVQTEVTLNPRLSVLTPTHGGWEYLGDCQYSYTAIGLLYNISNGKKTGHMKVNGRVALTSAHNVLIGVDKAFIYDAAGNLVFQTPEGQTTFTRTVVEPYN